MNVRIAKQGILVHRVCTTILLVQRARDTPAVTVCAGQAVLTAIEDRFGLFAARTRITVVFEMIKPPRNGGFKVQVSP